MRFILIIMSALFLLIDSNLSAQDQTTSSLSEILQTMPIPKPSLKEMMADNSTNEVVEKNLSSAFATINRQIDLIYQPVYERFRKAGANHGGLKLTAAEQKMMTDVKLGAKGLTEASQFEFFKIQMKFRLPVRGSRPMWAHTMPAPKSTASQKIYQRLQEIEAGFDWKLFLEASEKHVLTFGSTNKSLDDINRQFNADIENLPKKKVMLSGFTHEIGDPDKAIALCRKYSEQRQKAFGAEYAQTYSWWNQQYLKLQSIAESTDQLAAEMKAIDEGSNSSLQPFIADLQIRTLEALYKLTAVTQRLYNDRLIGLLGEQQVEEMITMYTQYKEAN